MLAQRADSVATIVKIEMRDCTESTDQYIFCERCAHKRADTTSNPQYNTYN